LLALHFAEQHIKFLHQLKQPIPQTVSILLAEARRKEDKKVAKRIANRKSASSSRARKKALVKEMTEMNVQLKRQALILSLIPDMVIVINEEGLISFCSAQVERVMNYKHDDLLGESLFDHLIPSSRDKLRNLMLQLVSVDASGDEGMENVDKCEDMEDKALDDMKGGGDSKEGASVSEKLVYKRDGESSSIAVAVSEPTFPLSVVKVDPIRAGEENDNSDVSGNSGSKEPSSLTNSALTRSPTAESLGNSGSDDNGGVAAKGANESGASKGKKAGDNSSSDTSNTSSLSTNAVKLKQANANLERNVRWANKKLKDKTLADQLLGGFKDDVMGATVTANNATARLSSLRHCFESSSEEDSGYRESNESREETSSSSDSSECVGECIRGGGVG
jgi:PAS domain S-box-containing protein